MRDHTGLSLAKWPFLTADALLLTTAYLIYLQSARPMGLWQVGLAVVCVAGGACVSIIPFLLEYRVAARLAERRGLASAMDQLGKLENVAAQITAATEQWLTVREDVGRSAATATSMAARLGTEVQRLTELGPLTNDTETAKVRLDVRKLGQAEGDWLQVLVQVLDHVYALQVGALHSGQPHLIGQLSNFQDACRDAARRIGLTPFIAEPAGPFDAQRHQWVDGEGPVPAQSAVAETIATGYNFKGRLLRPALVRLLKSDGAQSAIGQTEGKLSHSVSEAKEHAQSPPSDPVSVSAARAPTA